MPVHHEVRRDPQHVRLCLAPQFRAHPPSRGGLRGMSAVVVLVIMPASIQAAGAGRTLARESVALHAAARLKPIRFGWDGARSRMLDPCEISL